METSNTTITSDDYIAGFDNTVKQSAQQLAENAKGDEADE